ncbi:bifunctional lysylphosphatidylglycerol flippase/synthetase MprF [Gimesia chilikensis]|uniref:Phosphatidylglycerol lysyltransferase n=1 Tax=Gimesia chilikensis TaxID=2605989 RepID=A0A517PKL4_9PLAN|nr:bifunctional lysylphosphatidylglycerol flippase/synthetase MprF [Gimesia chilikensis]QDT19919.1 Phosphatidylglycerol lysyltransferase [Gimesia chilikensis]
MLHRLKQLAPLLVITIFVGAIWLLVRELKHYNIHDIRSAVEQIPAWRLWAAGGLTVLNYVLLIGYDYLAVRAIQHPLSLGKISLASFTGFVTSYNFGALLGGTSVRYRLYSAWGLTAMEILQLMLMLGTTYWVGVFALAGVVFLSHPFPIPASLHLPFSSVQPLGGLLLAVAVVYASLTLIRKSPIRVKGIELRLPSTRMTLLQLAVSAGDLLLVAAIVYTLLAHNLTIGYGEFLGIFLMATVTVVLSHVPGGVGVFELVILTLVASPSSAKILAGLLVFRVIYYLIPLFFAVILMGLHELSLNRGLAQRTLQQANRWSATIAPLILSWCTLLAGAVLLFSGATPIVTARLGHLQQTLPLPLVEISHFLGSLIGAALLVLARGLQRRLDSAWWLITGLLSLGILVSLLKGFDYEEAILLGVILLALLLSRQQYYRKGTLIHDRFSLPWAATILSIVLCSLWLGLFAYRNIEYSHELWWAFTIKGDASRFMRGSIGAISVVLLFSIARLTSAQRPQAHPPTTDELALVRQLVTASPVTSTRLALLGDKSLLFNPQQTAFIMYGIQKRSWISLGDPVGPEADRAELVWQFRELVDLYDGWPVFYQIRPENLSIYLDQGLTILKLGEEARVPLTEFELSGGKRRKLRQAINHCEQAECGFTIIPREQVPAILPELKRISDDWLQSKSTKEKGFSLGYFDETYLSQFPIAVVKQRGTIIAFTNILEGADKEELSADLMRYDQTAPPGVMEYLFVKLMLWGQTAGYAWFNFGMAPLSGIESRPLSPVWNRTANLIFRYGDHFYRFEGLRSYKEKFDPVWTPKYLAAPGGLALPQILRDLVALIGKPHTDSIRRSHDGPLG